MPEEQASPSGHLAPGRLLNMAAALVYSVTWPVACTGRSTSVRIALGWSLVFAVPSRVRSFAPPHFTHVIPKL